MALSQLQAQAEEESYFMQLHARAVAEASLRMVDGGRGSSIH